MGFILEKAAALTTGTVTVRGQEIAIRAVSAKEADLLNRLFPRPVPTTLCRPKDMGSLAPDVPDENEPGFRPKLASWFARLQCLVVVLGADVRLQDEDAGAAAIKDLKDDAVAKWFDDRVDAIRGLWSLPEIAEVYTRIMDLGRFDQMRSALIEDCTGQPKRAEEVIATRKFKLPDRYRITDLSQFLRVCSRYGINPFLTGQPEYDHPELWHLLIHQEHVFAAERERELQTPAVVGGATVAPEED